MSVAKMKKVYLIGHQEQKDCKLGLLQRMAVMEVNDLQGKAAAAPAWNELLENDGEQESLQEVETQLVEIRFALDFMNRHSPVKKEMFSSLEDNRKLLTLQDFNDQAATWAQEIGAVSGELRRADEKLMSLRNEETRLQNLRTLLQPWGKLDVPLQDIRTTAYSHLELGILSRDEPENFRTAMNDAAAASFQVELNGDRDASYLLLGYAASSKEVMQEVLKQFSFNRQDFSSLIGTPSVLPFFLLVSNFLFFQRRV